jgi:diaminopimelate epimerase
MKKIECHKYHALGNDFLIIDQIMKPKLAVDAEKLVQKICHRNTGVGADGILLLRKSKKADFAMDIYNSDGSWAEKSGNGLRIATAYCHETYFSKKHLSVETASDIASARIIRVKDGNFMIKVSLGKPSFEANQVPIKSAFRYHINRPIKIEGDNLIATALSVGNPHIVVFVDNFDFDWKTLGCKIENDRIFSNRTNVEFVKVINKSKVILNDWERGAGATSSSGTGAAASVVAGAVNGFLVRKAEVVFPLGSLFIDWSEKDDCVYLTGPVRFVCKCEYSL